MHQLVEVGGALGGASLVIKGSIVAAVGLINDLVIEFINKLYLLSNYWSIK